MRAYKAMLQATAVMLVAYAAWSASNSISSAREGVAQKTAARASTRAEGLAAWQQVYSVLTHARCIYCHGVDGLPQELDLRGNARSRLVGVPSREQPGSALVNPGSPDLSYLWQRVSQPNPPEGQRMPRNGDPLLPDELETIRLWIEQGAGP